MTFYKFCVLNKRELVYLRDDHLIHVPRKYKTIEIM